MVGELELGHIMVSPSLYPVLILCLFLRLLALRESWLWIWYRIILDITRSPDYMALWPRFYVDLLITLVDKCLNSNVSLAIVSSYQFTIRK